MTSVALMENAETCEEHIDHTALLLIWGFGMGKPASFRPRLLCLLTINIIQFPREKATGSERGSQLLVFIWELWMSTTASFFERNA